MPDNMKKVICRLNYEMLELEVRMPLPTATPNYDTFPRWRAEECERLKDAVIDALMPYMIIDGYAHTTQGIREFLVELYDDNIWSQKMPPLRGEMPPLINMKSFIDSITPNMFRDKNSYSRETIATLLSSIK